MPVDREPLGPPVTWLAKVLADEEPQATRRASAGGLHTTVASLMIRVRSCVRPATQASMPGFTPKTARQKAPYCLRLSPPMHPPQGGTGAGPSNITRHYATWPHARASLVNAATSHNAALCVNGPEGSPQTPLGLTQGGGKTHRRSSAFKSIPTHQVV